MDPHIYPDPQTAPLSVPAKVGATPGTSGLLSIEENAAVDPVTTLNTMWIRVAKVGSGCATPGGANPIVKLKANTGDEVQVPIGSTEPIWNQPGGTGTEVANATMSAEANGVYLVRVFLFATGSTWQMRIDNDDAVARSFTWVVASTDALSKQPWIDIPTALPFDVLTGQSVPLTLQVPNKGTGPLTISDTAGTSLGSGFTLTTVPGPIQPNTCGNLTITFVGPNIPGMSNATYTVASNDTTAQLAAGHNKRVNLMATTSEIFLVPFPGFAPSPNQFSPKVGTVGQNVTLFGGNFDFGTVQVQFGGVNATVSSVTATQIVTQVPVGVTGGVKITVTTGAGSVVSDDTFSILTEPPLSAVPSFAPSPNQFSPKVQFVGQNVTLFGNNFDVGTVQVQFDGVDATVISVTATQIVTQVPHGTSSFKVKITVTTSAGSVVSDDTIQIFKEGNIVVPPTDPDEFKGPIDVPPTDEFNR